MPFGIPLRPYRRAKYNAGAVSPSASLSLATSGEVAASHSVSCNVANGQPIASNAYLWEAKDEGGAWTTFRGKRLKILAADVVEGRLVPTSVQPEGKAPMVFDAWRNGAQPADDELFGDL